MDSTGRFHEIDCEADGSISMRIPPGLATMEEGERAACDAVLNAMNNQGGNWALSEKRPEGPETGVDRVAFGRAVVDKRRASRDEIRKMQVTKVIRDPEVLKALNKSGSSTGYSIDAAVDAMKNAVLAKNLKPAGNKDDIILVLDAMEVLLGAVAPVIHGFKILHGAESLGFKEIWIAGPSGCTFRLI